MLPFFLAFLLSAPTSAAVLSTTSPAVPFYRSPASLFASGQTSRQILEETLRRTQTEVRYSATWNKKSYKLKGQSLLRDIQVAKQVSTTSSAELLNEKKEKVLQNLSKDTSLTLLETDEYWALVLNPKNKLKGYLPLHLLQAKNEDTGYYINIIDTYLRKSTILGSAIITTIPRMSRLEIVGIKQGWLELNYNGHRGFADINHFVSRADFAVMAFHPKHKWFTITHRENDFVVTNKDQRVPIKELWGMVTSPQRAIISDNKTADIPPLRAQIELVHPEAYIWGISQLADHGEVWWQKNNILLNKESLADNSETITTEQLIKRKIYSIAFAGKDSLQGLASAHGIYSTSDGIKWTRHSQFSEQNYPVNIHPDGAWFVGSYRSNDQGKNFDPFIRWDNIAKAIEGAVHRAPKILRITKIEALPYSKIQIQVDTGLQNLKLRSHLLGEHWEVVKK